MASKSDLPSAPKLKKAQKPSASELKKPKILKLKNMRTTRRSRRLRALLKQQKDGPADIIDIPAVSKPVPKRIFLKEKDLQHVA